MNFENKSLNNKVRAYILVDTGCRVEYGEYSIYIQSMLEPLNTISVGGVDDISLINDAIENNLPPGSTSQATVTYELIESGEWEGLSFNKYFEVVNMKIEEW